MVTPAVLWVWLQREVEKRSQKEPQTRLTLCWRIEAPNEKQGQEQSWWVNNSWEGWRASELRQVLSVMSADLRYGLYEPR